MDNPELRMGAIPMNNQSTALKLSEEIRVYFLQLLNSSREQGDIGFCSFKRVFEELMPVQQEKLRELTGNQYDSFMRDGSIVCIGIAYRASVMDYINSQCIDSPDYVLWNRYAREYDRLNKILNRMSNDIADRFNGIPLTATIGGMIDKVTDVTDYYGMVISHRVIAENCGIGWRGKNQLTVHEKFSCAIRFASIIIPNRLIWGEKPASRCDSCSACEEICSFIKNRDRLPNYRENCRRYILFLKSKGLEKDVCGKCVKACCQDSIYRGKFLLPN